jgi:biopolymer transport protein ExbD
MSIGDGKGRAMAEMNVVPLIDILLVLLIIFMVITPLTPKGLPALIPQPDPNPVATTGPVNKTIVVQVLADPKSATSTLKINSEDATWESLGSRMDQIFKARAEKVAFVKGDNDVMFTDVARAIDIMRGAGVDKVGLITAKLEVAR